MKEHRRKRQRDRPRSAAAFAVRTLRASSSISSSQPVLAQQLGDVGKTTIVGYGRQLGRERVRGDQQIVAAHRLTAPFEIGSQPAIEYVGRRLERQHVKRPRLVSTWRASRGLPRLATP